MPSAPVPSYWYSSKVIESPAAVGMLVLNSRPDAWLFATSVKRSAPDPAPSMGAAAHPGTVVPVVDVVPAVRHGNAPSRIATTGAIVDEPVKVSENSSWPPAAWAAGAAPSVAPDAMRATGRNAAAALRHQEARCCTIVFIPPPRAATRPRPGTRLPGALHDPARDRHRALRA